MKEEKDKAVCLPNQEQRHRSGNQRATEIALWHGASNRKVSKTVFEWIKVQMCFLTSPDKLLGLERMKTGSPFPCKSETIPSYTIDKGEGV